jgi:hypothetical protein
MPQEVPGTWHVFIKMPENNLYMTISCKTLSVQAEQSHLALESKENKKGRGVCACKVG